MQGTSGYSNTPGTTRVSTSNDYNAPIGIEYTDPDSVARYLTFIPIISSGNIQSLKLYLDNILLPYSYDLPNYNMYVTTKTGAFDSYIEFFNTGANSFYST